MALEGLKGLHASEKGRVGWDMCFLLLLKVTPEGWCRLVETARGDGDAGDAAAVRAASQA